MAERFFTTSLLEEQIQEIQRVMNFSTKAAVIRICISLSLLIEGNPKVGNEQIMKDNSGMNYHRATIMGDDEEVYKALFIQHLGSHINDDEFFPTMFKAHLVRGMDSLYNYFKFNQNKEKMYVFLLEKLGGSNDISR